MNLIGEVGGMFGILLGWSLLGKKIKKSLDLIVNSMHVGIVLSFGLL